MILQDNQRGGAKNLALHLIKDENDHIELHEIRGFASNDLINALNEFHFISKATKAKQFLFSLSLNPLANESVSTAIFEYAIKQMFKECWAIRDSKAAFASALKNRGYTLAKGDRRGLVALDHRCEIFVVAKWSGVQAKDVKAKLGDTENLPTVSNAKT